MRLASATVASVAALGVASPACATGFDIRLRIPLECHVAADTTLIETGSGRSEIMVEEACNSPTGFTIAVAHRPLVEDEQMSLEFAGEKTAMRTAATGSDYAIFRRRGAKFGRRPLSVDHRNLTEPVVISVSLGFV